MLLGPGSIFLTRKKGNLRRTNMEGTKGPSLVPQPSTAASSAAHRPPPRTRSWNFLLIPVEAAAADAGAGGCPRGVRRGRSSCLPSPIFFSRLTLSPPLFFSFLSPAPTRLLENGQWETEIGTDSSLP
jgi:hypothetical protein